VTFGKYQLIRRLGAGGMAEVFLAREPLAGGVSKLLVVKQIHPSLAEAPEFRRMFEDEAKIAVALNHPNIVQTFGYGQIGATYYLAMEYVEGRDLLRLLNLAVDARRRVPFGLCAYLGQQIAKGLDYAHRKKDEHGEPLGIVHRDISPQNVLVSVDGAVKIVDFGIARARHVRDDAGLIKGKFAYMSPEQASGAPVDPRADIFATGIVLWELACGRSLFGGLEGRQAIEAVKNAQAPRPRAVDPQIPVELDEIIMKALARRPEDRFQTARDLHRALGKFFFELSASEGKIFESGTLAAFVAQLAPAGAPEPAASPAALAAPGTDALRSDGATDAGPPPALPISERRPVLVVEGRLSGMAAVRRQLGEARARAALLEFMRVCETLASKHGAAADRVDERGLRYLVGLPVGAEDDAARATRLAAALIDALDGVSRDLDPGGASAGRMLGLAVGVQRGAALVSRTPSGDVEHQLLGATARLAERLADEALPGEVLVGGGVYRAARGELRFEELEAIDLPDGDVGDEPGTRARVYRLLGARGRSERLATRAPRALGTLVGRDRELAALAEAHRAVLVHKRPRHVLILGEQGVGKRSLVDAFVRGLDAATHLVLRAAGRPVLRDTPYALAADLARDLLGVSEETDPREVRRRVEAATRLLFHPDETQARRQAVEAHTLLLGIKSAVDEELDPGERRRRLHDAMRRLERRLAEARTLVVIFEDMHWADQQSFDIIRELVRDPVDRPVLGIATARPGERTDELAREPEVTTLALGELGTAERAALVAERFADAADAAPLLQQILDRAGGNPFYIDEIVESLVERGLVAPDADSGKLRWIKRDEPISVPTTVEAVVASRLDRLSDEERDVIRRAALLGRSFRVDDVAALLGADPRPALERLATRGLVIPVGDGYAFRNLIVREVAYGGLAPDARALLHSVAADRLARAAGYRPGADDARLGSHFEAAGDRDAAARAYMAAGLYARDHAGPVEAFALFSRALALVPRDDWEARHRAHAERAQLYAAWGKRPAQLRELHALRKAAVALGDRRREAEAFCRLGALYLEVGKYAAAERELGRALALARQARDPTVESEALRLEAALLTSLGKNADALERARRAIEVLDGATDRAALACRAEAQRAAGTVHARTGQLRDAVSAYAEALVIYRRLGARRCEAAVLADLGAVLVGLGEYPQALVHVKRSLAVGRELGDRAGVGAKLTLVGRAWAALGDLERARRTLDKALELGGDPPARCDALTARAELLLRAGRSDEAGRDLERALALAVETRDRWHEIRALVGVAFCRLAAPSADDAAAAQAMQAARAAARLGREADIAYGEAYGLCAEALALLRAGDAEAALGCSTRAVALLDAGRTVDGPEEVLYVHARAARAAGDASAADRALGRALGVVREKAARLGDPVWRARYLAASPTRDILAAAHSGLDGNRSDTP
jgi:predicted ATPase